MITLHGNSLVGKGQYYRINFHGHGALSKQCAWQTLWISFVFRVKVIQASKCT